MAPGGGPIGAGITSGTGLLIGILAGLSAGLWTHAAPAQTAGDRGVVLPELEVTADRPNALPPATFVSPIVEITPGLPADGGDLLRSVPGVSGSRMGGLGIDPIIRGQTAGQLNILIDGAHAFGACPNRMDPPTVYVDLDNYDSVTVIKGSQTVRYGGGGSGGTILFERDTPRFGPGEVFRARLTGGITDNSHTGNLGADLTVGTPEGFARATGQYRTANNYEDGNGDPVRSAYNTEGAGLSLGLTPNDDARAVLSYDYTHDWDVLYAGAGMDGIYSDSDQWRLQLGQDTPIGPFAAVKAELYSVSVDHLMDNYSLRPLTGMFKMRAPSTADTAGGRLTADLEAMGMNWTIGTDYLQVDRDATRFWNYRSAAVNVPNSYLWPEVVNADLGLYVEIERPLTEQSRLTAGLRYDRTEASVSQSRAALVPVGPAWVRSADQLYRAYYGVGAEDSDEDNLGGFLTYAHDLNDGLAFSVGVSRTLRSADATERYIASNAAPSTVANNQRWVGNPGLDPEAHHQIGVTLAKVAKHWNTQLDLFYDRVDDYILRDRAHGQPGILLADGTFIYRNIDADLTGGEWTGSIEFARHWRAGASLAYVYAQNRTDSTPIAQTPPLGGTFSLDYLAERWSVGTRLSWNDTQDRVDDDPLTGSGLDVGPTAGWWILDLYGEARISKAATLSLGVDNLFDRAYAYAVNRANVDPFNPGPVQVNEPGRQLWARASLDF
jgi:iron complex outermembrane receptor protein